MKSIFLSATNSLRALIDSCTHPPYPHVRHAYVGNLTLREKIRIVKKYLHKRLLMLFKGQARLYRTNIPTGARVLFIYYGVTNLGDSLMDFSGRVLLKNKARLDLLIDARLADLYREDDVFNHVYTDPAHASRQVYDFIVLNNLNIRTIKEKARYFKMIPYTSIQGYYFGYDYNHIELSYSAFNSMYDLGLDGNALSGYARPYLSDNDSRYLAARDDFNFDARVIAIAVGGREEYRIYRRWQDVLYLMMREPTAFAGCEVVLLGSENGLEDAQRLLDYPLCGLRLRSYVNNLNLIQCRALLSKASVFLASDGGLLHLAHTLAVPTISLFSAHVGPEMRLSKTCPSIAIQSSADVNDIEPQTIFEALKKVIGNPP